MRFSLPPPAIATLVLAALLLAGCGTPPGLEETPAPRPSGPATPTAPGATGFTPVFPTAGPLPSGEFPTEFAVSCAGDPAGDDVIGLLRDQEVIAGGAEVAVAGEPLCAGDWQYTVITVPDLDPLQVVTRRAGDGLELVTAGSNVCTAVEVEVQAPPGLRAAAGCVG